MTIEIHDRYSATGREPNGCERCEGMGCFPLRPQDIRNEAEQRLYDETEPSKPIKVPLRVRVRRFIRGTKVPTMSAWRFVKCPDCPGPKSAAPPKEGDD